MEKTKVCNRCKTEKTLDLFPKNKNSKDGFDGRCKQCSREYYHANKEKCLERNRKRREEMQEVCKVEGCNDKVSAKGYCNRHYKQMNTFGEIRRTRVDPNEIVIKEDYAEMKLYDKYGNERNMTLIDIEDVPLISMYKWCYKEGYVMTGHTRTNDRKLLHRFIVNAPNDKVVDHINQDTLDNRKCNLRICTVAENNRNSSKTIGVYRRKDCKSDVWRAMIMVNRKPIKLGKFNSKEEALKVRQKAELKYFGEFAPIRRSQYEQVYSNRESR
jgi:hypothetical protein